MKLIQRLGTGKIAGGVAVVVGVIAALLLLPLLPSHTLTGKWQTPLPVVTLGIVIGLTYGLLAVGLVIIYRANRIINFAHGEIGAFGAALLGLAVVKWHVPYWIAVLGAVTAAGAVGAIAEVGVVRRLRNAPRLMSVVATLGVGQFVVAFAFAINSTAGAGSRYPDPSWLPTFHIGALTVTPAYTGMLFLSPLVVIALGLFLKWSRFGLAIRGAADNPELARLSGVFSGRMSSLAWGLAGGLAAFTAILTQPTQGFAGAATFGPGLLLRALAAAVIGRMVSIPVALLGGIGLGVIEQLTTYNYSQAGLVDGILFAIILVALLLQRGGSGREEEKGSWAAVQPLRPIPEHLMQFWGVRNLGRMTALVCLVAVAALPIVITNTAAATITGMFAFAIVGLSVGIVTGLGGQLTLGQFALAAVGGVVAVYVVNHTGDFVIAFIYAGAAAAVASLLIGMPALRIKGLLLTVTTLAFALVTSSYFLNQTWVLGTSLTAYKPKLLGHPLDTGKSYYYFAFAVLVGTLWVARNVREKGFGRLLVALRDNEDNARAFTVKATVTKLQAFLLSGLIAGIGGAVYAHSFSTVTAQTFPTAASINVAVMTVVGGVAILSGPLLGVLLVIGVPAFLPLDTAGIAATNLGLLLIILYLPGGLASLIEPIRERIIRVIAKDRWAAPSAPEGSENGAAPSSLTSEGSRTTDTRRAAAAGHVVLEARDLQKSFGGVRAVDGVSLSVRSGETVGLIGPNGAGKTTTFELLGGFTRADKGSVVFDGLDVTHLNAEGRARLGLIRSFQDAALFPTMTVEDVVKVALERLLPTRVVLSTIGLPVNERAKTEKARELISFMGLDAFRTKQVRELSTGTRRIAELACLIATEPSLLLLDEPSSGIAQKETEQLGRLLADLRQQFDMTLVVIEHDIPLIMSLADRIVAMDAGQVIAEGTPDVVRNDPLVIEAYLGGSVTAIERSGALSTS
ncbi:MAG: ATP-binding cassette domain-containing protein [Actinomycetota bacterium]|nr:ATP-binding cassette domain-containing protein [Actinomycetota bacterium]